MSAFSLTACTALQDAPIDYTVSVEIVDGGKTDPGTPGGNDLADLVGSSHCRAWTPQVISAGADILMVQLLLYDAPLPASIVKLRGLPNVDRVIVQSKTGGFADPPAFENGQTADRLIPCASRRR